MSFAGLLEELLLRILGPASLRAEAPARAALRMVCRRWLKAVDCPDAWPGNYGAAGLRARVVEMTRRGNKEAALWLATGPFRSRIDRGLTLREFRGAGQAIKTHVYVSLDGTKLGACPRCGTCSLLGRAPAPAAGLVLTCPDHRKNRHALLLCVARTDGGECGRLLSAGDRISLRLAGGAGGGARGAWVWAGVAAFGKDRCTRFTAEALKGAGAGAVRRAACTCCGTRACRQA